MGRDSAFGKRLAEMRAQRGLSLRALGELASFSRGFIWDLEAGNKSPGAATAARLDEALGAGGRLAALAPRGTSAPRATAAVPTRQLETLRREVTETISSSALSPAAVEDWEQTVIDHGRATRYRHPAILLGELASDFADLQGQLGRHHRPRAGDPARAAVVCEGCARGSGIPRPADDDRRVGRGRVVLTIEHATAADIARLAELMEEMDRFYGAAEVEPQARREKEIGEALFGTRPVAYALLAKDRRDVVGLASYSLLWPAAGLTSSLFLKELYVRQDKRRRGVGRRLMRELCAIAVAAGCSRVEWQTEDANERARRFYEALGAPVFAGKVFYRLEGDGLRRLTES